jgi:cytochrome c oxidase assembly factor 6
MPPGKEERDKCYMARDAYFDCLDAEISNSKQDKMTCSALRQSFQSNCLKSWVEHFTSEREKEILKQKTLQKLELQRHDSSYLENLLKK